MPRTVSRLIGKQSSSPSSPAYPFLTPRTVHPRLRAESTALRMTALSPGASPPPVEIAMRTRSSELFVEQGEYLARARVAAELRLLEDRGAVAAHLEPPAARW